MREIKFRGISKNNNRWIYGFVSIDKNSAKMEGFPHFISRASGYLPVEVVPRSVGQYIGLKDEYGIEIYDGDIVEIAEQPLLRFEIVYSTEHAAFMRRWLSSLVSVTRECGTEEHIPPNTTFWKVIGNRYENPELLQ